MIKRMRKAFFVLLATAGTATTMFVGGGTASADSGNANAGVYGGTVHDGYCAEGDFCIFTDAGPNGHVFGLPDCTTYTLTNWNGWGTWWNNQTGLLDNPPGSLNALLEDVNHNARVIWNEYPNSDYNAWHPYAELGAWGELDFTPIWYIRPCSA